MERVAGKGEALDDLKSQISDLRNSVHPFKLIYEHECTVPAKRYPGGLCAGYGVSSAELQELGIDP